ncbi:hypothetical protein MML48_3g00014410 [Holotrichia oblita]|uniref:Uncharacterized protein n=1 Tax=Holotrichia oblita TaxID=644536 RepID=A0ACB9TBX4_HOLOL|nr:hypothetical protein MML48_3g00014410 [Holotrichia oblita]
MFGSPMKMGIAMSAIPKDMIGLLRSEEDLENLLHSQNNTEENINVENVIEQDKENYVVEDINSDSVRNKTQITEMIETEKMKEKQITNATNLTIQRYIDSVAGNATQVQLNLEN